MKNISNPRTSLQLTKLSLFILFVMILVNHPIKSEENKSLVFNDISDLSKNGEALDFYPVTGNHKALGKFNEKNIHLISRKMNMPTEPEWHSVGMLAGKEVSALQINKGVLYVGGSFNISTKDNSHVKNIAKWDGKKWDSVLSLSNDYYPRNVTHFNMNDNYIYFGENYYRGRERNVEITEVDLATGKQKGVYRSWGLIGPIIWVDKEIYFPYYGHDERVGYFVEGCKYNPSTKKGGRVFDNASKPILEGYLDFFNKSINENELIYSVAGVLFTVTMGSIYGPSEIDVKLVSENMAFDYKNKKAFALIESNVGYQLQSWDGKKEWKPLGNPFPKNITRCILKYHEKTNQVFALMEVDDKLRIAYLDLNKDRWSTISEVSKPKGIVLKDYLIDDISGNLYAGFKFEGKSESTIFTSPLMSINIFPQSSDNNISAMIDTKALHIGPVEHAMVPNTVATIEGAVAILSGKDDNPLTIDKDNLDDYLLWVEQGIVASDMIFSAPKDWSDYVFEDDYELMDLEKLNAYIQNHGHLPGIPSEKEIIENGYSVLDMNKKFMAKIEELVLYTIQLEEDIAKQDELMEEIDEVIKKISQPIERINKE